jgi:hypothetical protein
VIPMDGKLRYQSQQLLLQAYYRRW